MAAAVSYAVGSGAKVRSYIVDRLGYLLASPACWYPHGGRWDLAPGYEARDRHFNRPVTPGCLFCHSNFAEHVEGTVNQYREPSIRGFAIGCERCHGPGELHVAARGRGEPPDGKADLTIVNPTRLETGLRQAICEQCHLQGEERVVGRGRGDWDFRPGLPLYPFVMDFVDGEEWDMPMLNVFRREGGTVRHFWGSELLYVPPEAGQEYRHNDLLDPVWNFFDVTPQGRGDFQPKLEYR